MAETLTAEEILEMRKERLQAGMQLAHYFGTTEELWLGLERAARKLADDEETTANTTNKLAVTGRERPRTARERACHENFATRSREIFISQSSVSETSDQH